MACGDKYRKLVVTTSGYTLDNPYGSVAIPYDYAEWMQLAEKLAGLADQHRDRLAEIETKLDAFPKWNATIDAKFAMSQALDDMPWTITAALSGSAIIEAIGKAQAAIQHALCLLELSDDGIASYGELPPAIPGLAPKSRLSKEAESTSRWKWIGGMVLGVVAIGGSAYALSKIGTAAVTRPRLPKPPPKEIASAAQSR